MKIYKSVTIDIDSGEILHEDSYEYDGPIAHLGGDGDGNGGNGDVGASMGAAGEGQIGGPGSMGGDPGAPGVGPGIGTGLGLGGGVGASNIGGAASEGQIGVPAGQMASDLGISIGQAAAAMLGAGLNPATGYGMPGFAEAFGQAVARGYSHSDAASIAQAASAMNPSNPATMGLVGSIFGMPAELDLAASLMDAAPGLAVGTGLGMLGGAFGVPGLGLLGSATGLNAAIANAIGLTPEAPDFSVGGMAGTLGGLGLVGEAEGGGGVDLLSELYGRRGRRGRRPYMFGDRGRFPTWALNRLGRGRRRLPRPFREARKFVKQEGRFPYTQETYKPYHIDAPLSEIFAPGRSIGDIITDYGAPKDLGTRIQLRQVRKAYENPQAYGLPEDYPGTVGLDIKPK